MNKLPIALRTHVNVALVICLCFLACSTGYLSWLYNVMNVVGQERAEFFTLVLGYAAQAAGIGIYALVATATAVQTARRLFVVALCAHVLALVPATMSDEGIVVLAAGYVLNALYGIEPCPARRGTNEYENHGLPCDNGIGAGAPARARDDEWRTRAMRDADGINVTPPLQA